MIESPLIQEVIVEDRQKFLLVFLNGRFGSVPEDIISALESIGDAKRLTDLGAWAGCCPDLDSFRARLRSD